MPFTHDGVNDRIDIFLHSTTTLASQHSTTQLIAQFLPAVSAERDFSIGFYGQVARYTSSGNYYYRITGPLGGYVQGTDVLLQISEPNVVQTMFNGPTSPGRQDLGITTVNGGGTYYDSIALDYIQYFSSVQILHTTTTVDEYDSLTIKYTPKSSISTFSSTREVTLTLSIENLYYANDGGLSDIFSADGVTIESGHRFSEVVSNPNGGEVTTIQFGQYSQKMTPLRLTLARQSSYSAGTEYTWRIPLLKNPSVAYTALRYNLTLAEYPASTYYAKIWGMYQSINEYYTVTDTSTSFNPTVVNSNRNVQVTNGIDLSIDLDSYSLGMGDVAVFKVDNSYEGLLQDLDACNDTSNYDYYYFHTINMVIAQKKNNNNIYTVGINSDSESLDYQRQFKFSWVKVHDTDTVSLSTNPQTLKVGDPPALMLNYLTTYSAATLTKLEGTEYQSSAAMYQLDLTVPIIPEGGEIQIKFDPAKIEANSGAHCRVGTNFVRSSNDEQALRCYRISDGFRITGFSAISTGTSVRIYFHIKSLAALTAEDVAVDIYGIYDDSTSSISKKSNTVSITHVADSAPSVLERIEQLYFPYYSTIHFDRFYELEGSLTLRNNDMFNGDSIRIQDPFGSYGNYRFLIKKNASDTVEWIEPSINTISTNSQYEFIMPTNYLVDHTLQIGTQYIWKYTTTEAPYSNSAKENGFIPTSNTQKFFYFGENGGSVT